MLIFSKLLYFEISFYWLQKRWGSYIIRTVPFCIKKMIKTISFVMCVSYEWSHINYLLSQVLMLGSIRQCSNTLIKDNKVYIVNNTHFIKLEGKYQYRMFSLYNSFKWNEIILWGLKIYMNSWNIGKCPTFIKKIVNLAAVLIKKPVLLINDSKNLLQLQEKIWGSLSSRDSFYWNFTFSGLSLTRVDVFSLRNIRTE